MHKSPRNAQKQNSAVKRNVITSGNANKHVAKRIAKMKNARKTSAKNVLATKLNANKNANKLVLRLRRNN